MYWPVQLKTPPLAYIASYYLHIFLTWPKVFLWTLPRVSVSSTSNRVDADTVKSRWVARGCLLLRCPGGSTSSAAPSVLMLDLQTVMFALCMSYKGAPVEHTWYCIGCSVGRPIVVHTMVVSSGSTLRIVRQQSNLLSQIIWSFFVEGLLKVIHLYTRGCSCEDRWAHKPAIAPCNKTQHHELLELLFYCYPLLYFDTLWSASDCVFVDVFHYHYRYTRSNFHDVGWNQINFHGYRYRLN